MTDVPWARDGFGARGLLELFRGGPVPVAARLASAGPLARARVGPTVRYIVNDGALVHAVLAEQAGAFSRERQSRAFRTLMGDGMLSLEDEPHHERRRIVQPAFGQGYLTSLAPLITRTAAARAEGWAHDAPVRLDREMALLSTELTARCLLGSRLPDEEVATLVTRGPQLARGVALRMEAPGWFSRVPTPERRVYRRRVAEIRAVTRTLLTHRSPSPCGRDPLTLLTRAQERGLPDRVVPDEALTLLTSGIETTATALTCAWYELTRHPDIERRLRQETRQNPPSDFTSRVVTETLRLHPPVPFLLRDAVQDVTIGDFRIPRGARLLLNLHAAHRAPAHYPEPHTFDPDRWLTRPPREVYLPFGAGRHRCVGASFFTTAAALTLTTIAARFHFRPLATSTRTKAISTTAPDRLLVTVHPHDSR